MYKLADYIMQATGYTMNEVLTMLSAMEVVIFMKNYKIEEISEIRGLDTSGDTYSIIYDTVYDRRHPEESTILNYKPNDAEKEELAEIEYKLSKEHELEEFENIPEDKSEPAQESDIAQNTDKE